MIDEERTFEIYGYLSFDLKSQSHKPVVAVCEECGKYRDIEKRQYRELCHKCAMELDETRQKMSVLRRRENLSEETLHKMSEASRRENRSEETLRKMSEAQEGKTLSEETKQKIRDSKTGEKNHFYGKKHTPETIQKMSMSQSDIHSIENLSEETIRKMSISHTGEKNHNWKGGISQWRNVLRSSKSYKNWRKAVFERDDYTCQICNVRGGYLEVHHVKPVRDNKNTLLILDVNNGITLCKKCHDMTKGNEYNFVEMFEAIIICK